MRNLAHGAGVRFFFLGHFATGVTVVVYPEGVWYGGVTTADLDEIIERHVLKGEIVERLLIHPLEGDAPKLPPLDTAPPAKRE